MNPNMLLTEGEQEFLAQEKTITDAVIGVIAVAKKENAYIQDPQVSGSVVEACKLAVGKTQQFKALMQGTFPMPQEFLSRLGFLCNLRSVIFIEIDLSLEIPFVCPCVAITQKRPPSDFMCFGFQLAYPSLLSCVSVSNVFH